MYPDLSSKVVVVTGAGRRIGRAISMAFAAEGARVVCADIDAASAEATAQLCNGRAVACDVSDEQSIAKLFESDVDVLVNNAGVFPNNPITEIDAAEWDRVFAVNTRGVFLGTRAAARQMIARGVKGSIVCVSSIAAETQARLGAAHYCASKAAVSMFVRVAAIELGHAGIRVNAVAPGMVRDEVLHWPGPPEQPFAQAVLSSIPLRRSGRPEEIAAAVVWLASEQASWVTGAIVPVTGGAHAGATHLPFSKPRA
jgi:NAD(P)-dependent dehydrogenase (short-subunit alcohol dehydrogenase family)